MNTVKSILVKFFLIMLIAAMSFTYLSAQANEKGSLIVRKCLDFDVTGDGSSSEWKKAEWVELKQKEPIKSSYTARAKVLYSETGIYLLYDCPDKKLTATMKEDFMDIYNEDVVEAFFWTDETFPVYFEYEISPLDIELPIMVPNYKGKFFGWLPWHYEGERRTRHATSVTGGKKESGASIDGWKAEVFIPFKLLVPLNNVPPVSGTKWRANMYRIDYDNGTAHFAWQKVNRSFHEYNNYGTFIFE